MIRRMTRRLRRFGREDDGHMLIEFALLVPLVFTIFLTSVELGVYQVRQMFLDRGLDMTVRLVRLNTGANDSHDDLKDMICNFAGFIENCDTQLKLEMNPVNPRNFQGLDAEADCADVSQPVSPNRSFVHGIEHQMMLLRACYKFRPVFSTSGLGYHFAQDGDDAGMARMISVTAFVQEP